MSQVGNSGIYIFLAIRSSFEFGKRNMKNLINNAVKACGITRKEFNKLSEFEQNLVLNKGFDLMRKYVKECIDKK